MLKKKVSSLLVVSAIGLGVFASGASAEQSGPATASDSVSANLSSTKHGASSTVFQFQAGKTNGSALFKQKANTSITLTDPNSSTTVSGESAQETGTTEPTHVVQNQVDRTSGIQYEKSFKGGPTLQFQQVQRTSINYNVGVGTVSPH